MLNERGPEVADAAAPLTIAALVSMCRREFDPLLLGSLAEPLGNIVDIVNCY